MSKEDGCPRQAFVLQPATPIEPDDHDEDIVSEAYLASITQYPFENGRRYHAYAPGQYYFPNDEKEMERQDIEHQTTLLLMDGELYKCPLRKNPSKILDLGTGTGIWCIDMADKFPDCEVIGTDLSPIQPELVPPNCKFYVDNYEDEW
jgi:SAM-dependent methyltransferase